MVWTSLCTGMLVKDAINFRYITTQPTCCPEIWNFKKICKDFSCYTENISDFLKKTRKYDSTTHILLLWRSKNNYWNRNNKNQNEKLKNMQKKTLPNCRTIYPSFGLSMIFKVSGPLNPMNMTNTHPNSIFWLVFLIFNSVLYGLLDTK